MSTTRESDESSGFHRDLGALVSSWAHVEMALFGWFAKLTALDEPLARAVFYSARSFQGRIDMLEATVRAATIDKHTREFLKAGCKVARQFYGFRNQVVHGEPIGLLWPTARFRAGQVLILQGKIPVKRGSQEQVAQIDGAAEVFTRKELQNAGKTFRVLAGHLEWPMFMDGTEKTSPQRHRELILQLPNPPHSKAADWKP